MRTKLIARLVLTAGAVAWVWSMPGVAQDAAPKPPVKADAPANDAASQLRVYDVRDLLLIVKDYPKSGPLLPPTEIQGGPAWGGSGGGGGGGGQALFNASQQGGAPAPLTPIEQLKHFVTDAVDPASWKDNGGSGGSIATLNGQLFITQTNENHTAIAALLKELRNGRAHMVRVRADWVLLPPGEIDKLLKNGGADTAALPEVSRSLLQNLPDKTVHYTGQIACFSGQQVHIASGRAKNFISNVTPVVAQDAVAMSPLVAYLHYGLSLEVTPTVSTDSATMDLDSVVSEVTNTLPAPTTQPALTGIDRMDNVIQRFHTTVQVPLNTPVLVGGTTADPSTNQPAGKELYLIIEADAGK